MQHAARRGLERGPARYAAIVAVLALACAARESTTPLIIDDLVAASASPSTRDGRVVLVTIDGVRWQEVFEGSSPEFSGRPAVSPAELMPRTAKLVASRGVALGATMPGCGTVHTAGASNVSLPGYTEIFTGHASHCLDNSCAQVPESVLDEAARVDPDAGAASIGAWEVLSRAVSGGQEGVFVSVGRSWPEGARGSAALAELFAVGQAADPYPGHGWYRPDTATAAIALAYYREAAPALFHIGLGDTDEYGHRGEYVSYLDALTRADTMIGALSDLLDTMGAVGEKTTVIITADHGRNSDFVNHGVFHPESGRSFVIAFGGNVPVNGIACPRRDLTLADIAPTIRVLMGLPRDTSDGAGKAIELVIGPS